MVNKEKSVLILLNEIEDIKKFANAVSQFESDVNIYYSESKYYDAKSIMAVLALDNSKPKYVEIFTDDEKEIEKFREAMAEFEIKED